MSAHDLLRKVAAEIKSRQQLHSDGFGYTEGDTNTTRFSNPLHEVYDDGLNEALEIIDAELAKPEGVVVPLEPTEEMLNAPRQIISYCETPGRTIEGLRAHLVRCGIDYLAFFPAWATQDLGHLTKSMIAALIYAAMIAANKETKNAN